ncbi:MAG: DUF47 family protein [Desulfobacterales bacterium]|nr:DUF47 family protein [Desulfobacterales bacterium]
MRIPLLSLFVRSHIEGLLEHAEKVKECSWAFQHAIEAYVLKSNDTFNEQKQKVTKLKDDADAIKRRIYGHLPKSALLPFNKSEFLRYINEQDKITIAAQNTLSWASCKNGVPEGVEKDFILFVDAVIDPIEELTNMLSEFQKYFKSSSEKQRKSIKTIIQNISQNGIEAEKISYSLKQKIFQIEKDAISLFHAIKMVEHLETIIEGVFSSTEIMRNLITK